MCFVVYVFIQLFILLACPRMFVFVGAVGVCVVSPCACVCFYSHYICTHMCVPLLMLFLWVCVCVPLVCIGFCHLQASEQDFCFVTCMCLFLLSFYVLDYVLLFLRSM